MATMVRGHGLKVTLPIPSATAWPVGQAGGHSVRPVPEWCSCISRAITSDWIGAPIPIGSGAKPCSAHTLTTPDLPASETEPEALG